MNSSAASAYVATARPGLPIFDPSRRCWHVYLSTALGVYDGGGNGPRPRGMSAKEAVRWMMNDEARNTLLRISDAAMKCFAGEAEAAIERPGEKLH